MKRFLLVAVFAAPFVLGACGNDAADAEEERMEAEVDSVKAVIVEEPESEAVELKDYEADELENPDTIEARLDTMKEVGND